MTKKETYKQRYHQLKESVEKLEQSIEKLVEDMEGRLQKLEICSFKKLNALSAKENILNIQNTKEYDTLSQSCKDELCREYNKLNDIIYHNPV